MATDAKFDKIQKIIPHENADLLEIAIVSNFPCIVKKGEFKEGEIVFYVRDDAKLLEHDSAKECLKSKAAEEIEAAGHQAAFPWQIPLLGYLGGGGRVKTCKLRGKISMGILLSPKDVCPEIECFSERNAEEENEKISAVETGSAYLEKKYGITHWVAPSAGFGALNVKFAGLPCSLAKTDQENWENLSENELHLGSRCLVTKKLDGTSTTVTCYPDDRGYDISSRGQTFNVKDMLEKGEENVYTKYTAEAVKAGLWYAKKHHIVIAIRGETCCQSVQSSSYNKDCKLNGFFVFGCEFPELENWHEKHGTYGTKRHFTEVVREMNGNGFNVKTVPILGEETVSKELLSQYNSKEWNWGEGIVVNVKADDVNAPLETFVWSYKSKSREYLMKMK